jgi:hypothetical protein
MVIRTPATTMTYLFNAWLQGVEDGPPLHMFLDDGESIQYVES